MLFNSLDFAIFSPIFLVIYWIVAKKLALRNKFLLVSNYLFYSWWDWRFLFLIIFSSMVDFTIGQKIYNATIKIFRKNYLITSLLINLGLLAYFKYTNFFIDSFINSFRFFGGEMYSFALHVILTVGISFYTFQTLSYTIDIYRDRIKPTTDWLSFFTFVAFFPQLVAGPSGRASHLLPQFFKTYNLNYKAKSRLLLMAFGLFKKMVIADSRNGDYKTYFNLFLVFVVSGIWHNIENIKEIKIFLYNAENYDGIIGTPLIIKDVSFD